MTRDFPNPRCLAGDSGQRCRECPSFLVSSRYGVDWFSEILVGMIWVIIEPNRITAANALGIVVIKQWCGHGTSAMISIAPKRVI